MTYISKPSLKHCSVVAKSIVSEYPFLRDNEGDGEVSILMFAPVANHPNTLNTEWKQTWDCKVITEVKHMKISYIIPSQVQTRPTCVE